MIRDVTVVNSPTQPPFMCSKCGTLQREWFVDCGFDSDLEVSSDLSNGEVFLPRVVDGVIYICSACFEDICVQILKSGIELPRNVEEIKPAAPVGHIQALALANLEKEESEMFNFDLVDEDMDRSVEEEELELEEVEEDGPEDDGSDESVSEESDGDSGESEEDSGEPSGDSADSDADESSFVTSFTRISES